MNDRTDMPAEELAANDPRRLQEVQALQRAMARGMDAEAFLKDDLGLYFRLKASRELEEAQEALVDVDAAETPRVRELQLKARVAQRVLTWFADAVAEGENAATQFQQVYDTAGFGG